MCTQTNCSIKKQLIQFTQKISDDIAIQNTIFYNK